MDSLDDFGSPGRRALLTHHARPLRTQEEACEIRIDHRLPRREREGFRLVAQYRRGNDVDEHVDSAESAFDGREDLLDRLGLGATGNDGGPTGQIKEPFAGGHAVRSLFR